MKRFSEYFIHIIGEIAALSLSEITVAGYEMFRSKCAGHEGERDAKLRYASVIVSLWRHACLADSKLQKEEQIVTGRMIAALFAPDALLAGFEAEHDTILDSLSQTFLNEPVPLADIAAFAEHSTELARAWYEMAFCLIYADGKLTESESDFLSRFAIELHLDANVAKEVERHFGAHVRK